MNKIKATLSYLLKHKILTILVVIVLLLAGFFIFVPRNKGPVIQTAKVQKQNIKATVSSSGLLAGKDTANLRFKISGKLAYLNVKSGDSVNPGDTIAGLDTQDMNITLQQSENNLRAQQANAEKTLDDIHLYQYGNGGFPNVGSPNETETQKNLRTSAQVARDNAVDTVRAAERQFQDSVIASPISGTVTTVGPVAGQIVTPTETVAQIVDWSQIYFDADIDESDIAKITVSDPVEITFNSYPDQTFKGTVEQVLPTTKTTTSGATVVTVRINLGNPSIHLISGLNGQASIIYAEKSLVLAIPQEALRDDNTVLIPTPKGPHSVKVTPGLRSDTDIEITSGLSENDTVITNPSAVKIGAIK